MKRKIDYYYYDAVEEICPKAFKDTCLIFESLNANKDLEVQEKFYFQDKSLCFKKRKTLIPSQTFTGQQVQNCDSQRQQQYQQQQQLKQSNDNIQFQNKNQLLHQKVKIGSNNNQYQKNCPEKMQNQSENLTQSYQQQQQNLIQQSSQKQQQNSESQQYFFLNNNNNQQILTDYYYLSYIYQQKSLEQLYTLQKQQKSQNQYKLPILPKTTKQYTVVLDLDNTLIHCKTTTDPNKTALQSIVYLRPFLFYFLEQISQLAELVLFTAGCSKYAQLIKSHIDPQNKYFSYVLSREHITPYFDGQKWDCYKDLSILGRNLDKTLLIDDKITNFKKQPKNGISIKPWKADNPLAFSDIELQKLATFLNYFITQNLTIRQVMNQQ